MTVFWTIIEILAMAFGVVYVVLEVRKSQSMWYFMIVASLLNILVYFHNHFAAMGLIQFYYIVSSIYGIRTWARVRKDAQQQFSENEAAKAGKVEVRRLNPKRALISSAIAVAGFVALAILFTRIVKVQPGDIPGKPVWDAAVAVLSMLATYWLSQSWREQWLIWIVVNVAAVIMFVYPFFHGGEGLLWMGLLYVIYIVSCIVGLRNWYFRSVIIEE
ncbi:MAG: nicotinamide mononucleotide transporter [Bacteroidales bacterium]|nr:nicotinamide mononucleotide transporter [Bacteroidales bacterium]